MLARTTTPRPITDDAAYATEAAKLSALRVAAADIQQGLNDTEAQIHEALIADTDDLVAERDAHALLSGVAPSSDREPLQIKAERLRRDLAAHRRAIVIQKGKVADTRATATAEAALKILPEHRRAVAGILNAITNLKDAIAVEQGLHKLLMDAGYEAGALPDFCPPLFILNDHDAISQLWVGNARNYAK